MIVDIIQMAEQSGWFSFSNVLALAASLGALAAASAAWFQLRTMSRQMRASTLLALDERWEGESLKPARDELRRLTKEISEKIREKRPEATVGDWLRLAGEMFPDRLYEIREKEPDRHESLLRLCGFFETAGYTAKAKYIAVEDVLELLGG